MMFDFPGIRVAACLTLSSLVASSCAMAQVVQAQNAAVTAPSPVDRAAVGDAPDDPGPLAHDLSARLKPTDIHAAMKKVADWQLRVAKPKFNRNGPLPRSTMAFSPVSRPRVIHAIAKPCCGL